MIPLGIAGEAPVAHLDTSGYVHFDDGSRVEWWILGDDYWHVPMASPSRRQRAVDLTPVVETVVRVPGGDVAWRVGALTTGASTVVVAECENRGTIPVAVGIAHVSAGGDVTLDVHAVAHTITWRGTLSGDAASVGLDSVARGWRALARQGSEVSFDDPVLDDALVAARVSLLAHEGALRAAGKRVDRDTAAVVATALTLLGYDDVAGTLRHACRLRPPRRGLPLVGPLDAGTVTVDPLELLADVRAAAGTVIALRQRLVRERGDVIDCLPGADDTWRGRSVEVRDLPTHHGATSFALRWHGDRPALLWTAPAPVTASALAPQWSSQDRQGEALLV